MAATNRSVAYTTQIVHIGSGTSLASNAMSPGGGDISTALSSTNLARYDRADIALMVINTTSISSASNTIILYRRDINFDGTNDEPVPATATSATWRQHLVGALQVPPWTVASTTYMNFNDVPIGDQCEFYIENLTNSTINAGWTLKVTPKTDSFA